MSNEKTPTIFERVTKVVAFIQPQRSASYKLKPSEKDASFEAASRLCFALENAARSLHTLPEEVGSDPLGAISDASIFEYSVQVEALLFRFEKWVAGEHTVKELVTTAHAFCTNSVMAGYLASMNTTSPLKNFISVIRYQAYCQIVKVIDNEVLRINNERERETSKA